MGTKAPMPHPHNIFQVLLHAVTLVPFRMKTVLCDTENRRKPRTSSIENSTKKNQKILKCNQLFERQMKKTFGIPFSKQNQYTVKIQDLASNVKIRKINKEAIFVPS